MLETVLLIRNFSLIDAPMQMKISFDDNRICVVYKINNKEIYTTVIENDKPLFFTTLMPVIGDEIVRDLLYSVRWTQFAMTVKSQDNTSLAAFAKQIALSINRIIDQNKKFYETTSLVSTGSRVSM